MTLKCRFVQPVFCCLTKQRWVNCKAIIINHNKLTDLYVGGQTGSVQDIPRGVQASFPQPCPVSLFLLGPNQPCCHHCASSLRADKQEYKHLG